jgi:NTE family protein
MKRGLVLSGGGAKGMFQIGALDYLIDEAKMDFDVISGVSVGALNGVMLAMDRYAELQKIWSTIEDGKVYTRPNFWSYVRVLFGARSLYSNRPLLKMLVEHSVLPELVKKPFHFGVVGLESGRYYSLGNEDVSPESILASTAIPVVWAPVKSPGDTNDRAHYVDGGVRNVTPIGDILHHDLDEIVVIACNNLNADLHAAPAPRNILHVATRSIEILLDEVVRNDLEAFLRVNELLQDVAAYNATLPPGAEPFVARNRTGRAYRHIPITIIDPCPEVDLGEALDFSSEPMAIRYAHGYEIARDAFEAEYGYIRYEQSTR